MDKDSKILCQKLRYMNMVIQEIQIQLSFFYDEFVHHASSTSSNDLSTLDEKSLLILEQGNKK